MMPDNRSVAEQVDDKECRQKETLVNQPVVLPIRRTLGGGASPVILVADDDFFVRKFITLFMQKHGYTVLAASDGNEGLALSRSFPGTIELAITDVNMPGLNGPELCAHLLEDRPGIRALLISGAHPSEFAAQIENLPFLPKPFDGTTLITSVRSILEGHAPPPSWMFAANY
jgi:CheY-like chemotaxis protein